MNYNFKDITNQTFGFLIAIRPTNKRSAGNVIWECECSCGRNTCPKIVFVHTGNFGRSSSSCQRQQHDRSIHLAIRNYFTRVRTQAYTRSYSFELTIIQFIAIIKQPCAYCGSINDVKRIPQHSKPRWNLRANGIDRWDNSLGYTLENCVPCCETCNQAKSTMSGQEYINHCKTVADNHKDRSE